MRNLPSTIQNRFRAILEGPLYELRIYHANEGRFQHLIKRFRDHTDRIFKKHGMKASGYWIPAEGSAKNKAYDRLLS